MISDVFKITNETGKRSPNEQPRVFLYDFCKDGKIFTIEDLDVILYSRLSK